jgi:hypothetical protein
LQGKIVVDLKTRVGKFQKKSINKKVECGKGSGKEREKREGRMMFIVY